MSTQAKASTVVSLPISEVWKAIRDFTFPEKLLKSIIEGCSMENSASPHEVGALRNIKWKTGDERTDRLLCLDDLHYTMIWELVKGEFVESSAKISTITCTRITDTNSTLVSWTTDYASDVSGKTIIYDQNSHAECLEEIKKSLSK
eukprot:gene1886-1027_t